jgi:CRISPR/Cas system-associated exonuclease Cas4 (RecB family)
VIKATSFSRLDVYEQCGHRARLAFIDRIKEPQQPPLPDGREYANDRGTRIHNEAENYVRSGGQLSAELKDFKVELDTLHELHQKDMVELEQMWLFDRDWQRLPDEDIFSPKIWLRIKCDAVVWRENDTALVVVDYKTGKRFGNEVKHAHQCQLYQLGAFLRYPKVKKVTTELWYTDQNELVSMNFTRQQGLRFFESWNERLVKMTSDDILNPRPSIPTCKWCPYKTGTVRQGVQGTGHCDLNPE